MPNIGDSAPLFSGNDVRTGAPFALGQQAGKVVVVAFNGISWCPPCQFEAPVLQDIWETYGESPNVTFVMVSFFDQSASVFKKAVDQFGITFPAVYDPKIAPLYEVDAVPQIFIIKPDQTICSVKVGALPPEDILHDEIETALQSCGAVKPPSQVDRNRWRIAGRILFGVTNDGGGVVVRPGGGGAPVGPWDPLRLTTATRDGLVALAHIELARGLSRGDERVTLQTASLSALHSAVDRLRTNMDHDAFPSKQGAPTSSTRPSES